MRLVSHRRINLLNSVSYIKCASVKHSRVASSEYTENPQYPEILDCSPDGIEQQKRQKWIDKVKKLPTLQHKQVEINDKFYYGYYSHVIQPRKIPYGSLPFAKHITRTHFIENDEPSIYKESDLVEETNSLYKEIKDQLISTIQLYNIQPPV